MIHFLACKDARSEESYQPGPVRMGIDRGFSGDVRINRSAAIAGTMMSRCPKLKESTDVPPPVPGQRLREQPFKGIRLLGELTGIGLPKPFQIFQLPAWPGELFQMRDAQQRPFGLRGDQ